VLFVNVSVAAARLGDALNVLLSAAF